MTEYFLKVDGIICKSKNPKFADWVELVSISFEAYQPTGGGGGAWSPKRFYFLMESSDSAISFYHAYYDRAQSGRDDRGVFPKAALVALKENAGTSTQSEIYRANMTNVSVENYQGGGGGSNALIGVTIKCDKIDFVHGSPPNTTLQHEHLHSINNLKIGVQQPR